MHISLSHQVQYTLFSVTVTVCHYFRNCIVGAIDGGCMLSWLDGVCEGVQEEGGTHLQVHTRQIRQGHLLVNTAAVDNI